MQEADLKRHEEIRGIAVAVVLALLSTQCHAQGGPSSGQCEQVRAAIAQHGLQAARKHAMQHHGLSRADLRTIEQSCGIGQRGGRGKR
jgi:ribosomal protein S9